VGDTAARSLQSVSPCHLLGAPVRALPEPLAEHPLLQPPSPACLILPRADGVSGSCSTLSCNSLVGRNVPGTHGIEAALFVSTMALAVIAMTGT